MSLLLRHSITTLVIVVLMATLSDAQEIDEPIQTARPGAAQPPKWKLGAEVRSLLTRARTGSPMPFEWILSYEGQGLLEGRLVYTVVDSDQVIARFYGDEMALTVGEQRFGAVLPAVTFRGPLSQATLLTEFVTPKERVAFRENILLVPAEDQRTLTLGLIGGPTSPTQDEQRLVDSLRFEAFRPDENTSHVVTVVTPISPTQAFSDPLLFCGFDQLVLSGSGFSSLSEKQLDAILKWIDAGGSACVVPGGNLAARHVKFLNELAAANTGQAPYVADGSGHLLPDGEAAGPPQVVRRGLGRGIVLATQEGKLPNFNTPEWREVVASLWKVRPKQSAAIVEKGKWKESPRPTQVYGQRGPANYNYGDYIQPYNPLQVQKFPSVAGLVAAIKPRNVEAVPVSVIGVTLLLYVLTIGPLEYFLLGKFKLRRLTWVVFPIVTFAYTVFALVLSNSYLGSNDMRHALEVYDIAGNGRVVRSSRYEMLFSSLARTVDTDIHQALFTPLSVGLIDDGTGMSGAFGGGFGESRRNENPPEIVGRVPSRHVVHQPVEQWTPQVNRIFSIAPEIPEAAELRKFDWEAPLGDMSGPGWEPLVERVQKAFGAEVSVCVMSGDETRTVVDSKKLASMLGHPMGVPDPFDESRRISNFLDDACKADETGLFSVVSQIAPTGGDNFEDLPVLDASDPAQSLLIILVEHEGTLRMYRKLYSQNP